MKSPQVKTLYRFNPNITCEISTSGMMTTGISPEFTELTPVATEYIVAQYVNTGVKKGLELAALGYYAGKRDTIVVFEPLDGRHGVYEIPLRKLPSMITNAAEIASAVHHGTGSAPPITTSENDDESLEELLGAMTAQFEENHTPSPLAGAFS